MTTLTNSTKTAAAKSNDPIQLDMFTISDGIEIPTGLPNRFLDVYCNTFKSVTNLIRTITKEEYNEILYAALLYYRSKNTDVDTIPDETLVHMFLKENLFDIFEAYRGVYLNDLYDEPIKLNGPQYIYVNEIKDFFEEIDNIKFDF